MSEEHLKEARNGISITQLPFDVILEIFIHLDAKDILKLERVCKVFRNEIEKEDERIWKVLAVRDSSSSINYFLEWQSSPKNTMKKTWKNYFWTQAHNFFFPPPSTPLGANSRSHVGDLLEISADRKQASLVKTRPGGTLKHHRIVLLQPAIPTIGVHFITFEIPSTLDGLWIGICCSSFSKHKWLGASDTSFAAGSHCPHSCYFNGDNIPIQNLEFKSGDKLSLKVDTNTNQLMYFINGKELEPSLDLTLLKRQEGDSLHFAVSFWVKPATINILSRAETDKLLNL